MARNKYIPKREILPDEKYKNLIISKFINVMMERGKKSVARSIIYSSLDFIKDKTKKEPVEVLEKALKNVAPLVEVKSRRVGGATYQVPIEVDQDRGIALAMRWVVMYARQRTDKSMSLRLANELLDAYAETGKSYKKKEDTHKMAEANKAFSHFRW